MSQVTDEVAVRAAQIVATVREEISR
jgi:hypothetical protein